MRGSDAIMEGRGDDDFLRASVLPRKSALWGKAECATMVFNISLVPVSSSTRNLILLDINVLDPKETDIEIILIISMVGLFLESELFYFTLMLVFSSLLLLILSNLSIG